MAGRSFTPRNHVPSSIGEYVRRCVTIDARSLAVFRMFVGVLVIADLLSRSRNFSFYYTDDGVVTQEIGRLYAGDTAISVFFLTQDPTIIAALFLIHGLVAVFLIAGYKTRLMIVLTFIFVISLDHHNRLVLSYADTLFRMLLFWAMFLPLGERWSIDALQRDRAPRRAIASLATAAILIQMLFMYFINGQNKYPSDRWHSGDAGPIVFGIDEMTFFLGYFMQGFPEFLTLGSRMWFYLLIASPLLLLLYGRARYPVWVSFFGGHFSFAITVRIGAFPYVAMLGLVAFLQPRFWDDLHRLLAGLGLDGYQRALYRDVVRFGTFIATRTPGRLIDFPARDESMRMTLTLLVVISMMGLFFFPAFSMAEEGPYLDADPFEGVNPIEDVTSNWGVSQPTWSIFAGPGPRNGDRYYVMAAQTTDGQVFDMYNERPMTYDRPGVELQRQHDAYRERFFMNSIRRANQGASLHQTYIPFKCNYWADERGVELEAVSMYTVRERITLDNFDDPHNRDDIRVSEIGHYDCDGNTLRDPIAPPDEFGFPPGGG